MARLYRIENVLPIPLLRDDGLILLAELLDEDEVAIGAVLGDIRVVVVAILPDDGERIRIGLGGGRVVIIADLGYVRAMPRDRKSVVSGKSVYVRVDLGGVRLIK